MLFVSVVCSLIYGVVAGTFSGGTQLWAAPVKIALGLMISALICLPSLYIFTCLGGSQARLVEVFGLLAGLLMLMTILLIGFAPVAWIFSQSTDARLDGHAASDFLVHRHLLRSAIFGNRIFALERPVPCRFPHLGGHFMLVALQMTTALRPILGTAKTFLPVEKKFFVAHWGDCLKGQDGVSKVGNRC